MDWWQFKIQFIWSPAHKEFAHCHWLPFQIFLQGERGRHSRRITGSPDGPHPISGAWLAGIPRICGGGGQVTLRLLNGPHLWAHVPESYMVEQGKSPQGRRLPAQQLGPGSGVGSTLDSAPGAWMVFLLVTQICISIIPPMLACYSPFYLLSSLLLWPDTPFLCPQPVSDFLALVAWAHPPGQVQNTPRLSDFLCLVFSWWSSKMASTLGRPWVGNCEEAQWRPLMTCLGAV